MQSCWRLFTVVVKASNLTPHFVRHYAALGYTDWHVAVHDRCGPFTVPESGMRVHFETCYSGPPTGKSDSELCNAWRQRAVAPDEWHSMADLDEFYTFPFSLRELNSDLVSAEIDSVSGRFIDRLALDGSLPEIDDRPLDEQFPRHARVTRGLLRTKSRKVMLMRGFKPLSAGHHKMRDEVPAQQEGEVHHFKWHAGTLQHLRQRMDDRADVPLLLSQCAKVVRHLETNGGRFGAEFLARGTWIPSHE